jgi:hypothetical protein
MKKIYLGLILTLLCLFVFSGCSTTDEEAQSFLSSQMILLEQYDDYSGLCYDKDTKIIYLYSRVDNAYFYSYSVYYVMDTNNNPIVGVYYE